MGPREPVTQDGIPTKRCPFCAEVILDTAKKCKYCNEYLDPSMRGKWGGGLAYWDGDLLRVPQAGFLRKTHCVICCQPASTSIKKTFNWAPPWLYVLVPIATLPAAIAIAILQKRQEVEVPLCAGCRAMWKQVSWLYGLFGVLGLIGLPWLFGMIADMVHPIGGTGVFWGIGAGLLAWGWGLFAIYTFLGRRRQVHVKRIDDRGAVLRVPNAALLATVWQEPE